MKKRFTLPILEILLVLQWGTLQVNDSLSVVIGLFFEFFLLLNLTTNIKMEIDSDIMHELLEGKDGKPQYRCNRKHGIKQWRECFNLCLISNRQGSCDVVSAKGGKYKTEKDKELSVLNKEIEDSELELAELRRQRVFLQEEIDAMDYFKKRATIMKNLLIDEEDLSYKCNGKHKRDKDYVTLCMSLCDESCNPCSDSGCYAYVHSVPEGGRS